MTDHELAEEIERQVNHPGNLARMGINAPKVVWFVDDDYWQQIIVALRSVHEQEIARQAKPQSGMVMVPMVPTETTLAAMALCYDSTWAYPSESKSSVEMDWARRSYRAMLAAAEAEKDKP